MAQKCVHQGCGLMFTDPGAICTYHPGPPVFHEGQKGWKCCKPRVLTFDEFMTIPPCTTGTHSTTDLPPAIEKKEAPEDAPQPSASLATNDNGPTRKPVVTPQNAPTPPPPEPPSESDDQSLEIPDGKTCRRKACGATYKKGQSREGEKCTHHPGAPIFHEGSKGYSCCKRRVLEFDEFMKIEGCKTKDRHLFIGSGNKDKKDGVSGGEEKVETVRHDYYQTGTTVIASFFLKKIVKEESTVKFQPQAVELNLKTSDALPKRYAKTVELFGPIDPAASSFKIMGTKLELTLVKGDGQAWPVLRADEKRTGEIFQIGKAGMA
ncbi:hypothetical protein V490_03245 [Pseudogymnoascus sp. VKM F-3557]|nr:hypothetical protein V490_03245 [Pseudogymnoascus sp. VKM F-3557]